MTNPGNIVRVRARTGGRASVYEANAWAQAFTSGVLDGVGVIQNTSADLNVIVGGSSTKPDVVLAQNPAGYKIALDLVGQQVIPITAPASNTRITSIVAYTDDLSLSTSEDSVTGSPSSCGLIAVNGTAAAVYNPPTDSDIRAAITADGATGSQASYAVLANITMSAQTDIITDEIIKVNRAYVADSLIAPAAIKSENVDFATQNSSGDIIIRLGDIQIISMKRNYNLDINAPWGSLYEGVIGHFDYPEPFDEPPTVNISVVCLDLSAMIEYAGDSNGGQPTATNTHTGRIALTRATAGNNANGYLCITAIGTRSN